MSPPNRERVTLGVTLATCLGLCALACGGKSQRDELNAQGGSAAQAGGNSGGRLATGGGVSSSSGGAASGGLASAGSPSGGVPSGGVPSGGAPSGGVPSGGVGSGGSTGGSPASGGAAPTCLVPDGGVQLEYHRCLIDSDCATFVVPTCCGLDRATGVAQYLACTAPPAKCNTLDCDDPQGFVTDDGHTTLELSEVSVICQFGEPGAGLCRTTVAGSDTVVCGANTCDAGELCVHLPTRGGPAPRCEPQEGAECPPGTQYSANCGGAPGCQEIITAPEPTCEAIPPGCGAPVACTCLPPEVCGPMPFFSCSATMGRHVYCADFSP